MSSGLTEDEMRLALGLDQITTPQPPVDQPAAVTATPKEQPAPRLSTTKAKARTPKLRVTLRVSVEFEGETTVLTHDSSSLSRIDAEQEARQSAKKAKYRYVQLVSIAPID